MLEDKNKKFRSFIAGIVLILLIVQTVSFIVISMQITKLNQNLDSARNEMRRSDRNLTSYFSDIIDQSEKNNIENFKEISRTIANQQKNIEQEISLLKSSTDDFSGIVKDSVKSVVSIFTEDGAGSGFVIYSMDEQSLIITNYHVLASGGNISVYTYDKQTLSANLLGYDIVKDVALVEIKEKYSALKFQDSSNVRVGSKVIAIGNPLGLSFTVTEGIVSGLDRIGPNGLNEYVQTDVSLNPGNSGGPLIDMSGKVIGMNNFKLGNADNLGFALESNSIKETINTILNSTIV